MRSRTTLIATLLLFPPTAALGQGPETFTPTETTTPDIPGVVTGGTRVQVVAKGLRGTEGPIAAPDGTLLLTEQAASVVTRIDAQGNRSTFLENTSGSQGLTFDQKGRLIGVLPAARQVATLTPMRTVLASTFEGKPFAGPNDLVADRKGGVYLTDPGTYPPPGQFLTEIPAVYYIRPDGRVVKNRRRHRAPQRHHPQSRRKDALRGKHVGSVRRRLRRATRRQRAQPAKLRQALGHPDDEQGAAKRRGWPCSGRGWPSLCDVDDRRAGVQPRGPASGDDPDW